MLDIKPTADYLSRSTGSFNNFSMLFAAIQFTLYPCNANTYLKFNKIRIYPAWLRMALARSKIHHTSPRGAPTAQHNLKNFKSEHKEKLGRIRERHSSIHSSSIVE
ncbi:hypothetical protein GQX74_003505 [Glossina fuscipes]|nr:hypothetical protein GQX74_003505 [Glossina fuscipes]